MILGCGEWGFRELPLEEHFRIARDFGFRHLEFGIGGGQTGRLPEAMNADDVNAFQKLVRQYEIQTPFCCLENDFTLPDAQMHASQLTVTQKQLHAAADCGAKYVRFFAGFTAASEMTEAIWGRMIDAFVKCQRLCGKLDLKISIETHGRIEMKQGVAHHIHSVTTRRDCLERLLRELPPEIGFNYDPGNLKPFLLESSASSCDLADQLHLDLLNDRINYCHLKDWRRSGKGWIACAPGDDDLDYATLLRQMTFEGVYLIEYEPLEDTKKGIRRGIDYLQRVCPALQWDGSEPRK